MAAMKNVLALLVLLGAPARADVVLSDVGWDIALQVKGKKKDFHRIDHWTFPPSPVPKRSRLRGRVSIRNTGGETVSAVLVRYSIEARLRRTGTSADGTWTVPFLVDEKRIPRLPASDTIEVPLALNRVALGAYLKRMYNAGYWPDSFRVRVMIEPRPGDTLDGRVVESTLPVSWRALAQNGTEPRKGAENE